MHLLIDLASAEGLEDVDDLPLQLENQGEGAVVEPVLVAVPVFLAAREVDDEISAVRSEYFIW